ncbi:uncharacterized protein YndB with AHSA1/START domain [Mucilaginibacter gracilis]|uniref:Uncharacterized protein YndB with AHSA1/START domain n=1 Tax=Mucilaginibacter gracilis TaxID=423350 RepID=A0A495JB70_9SPHI|nr:SRPBCC family protein [Mucilaginibacter gracilis]RKR85738.1 uncharacterized protein YndB with AHSA1/START domain [Mucilaginibacter gracilis]
MQITVETIVSAPVEKVWDFWTKPEHIINWCHASDDWHTPYADNDLQKGGKFKTTMAAKNGSFSFDFEGIYTNVIAHKLIEYVLADGRKVHIRFEPLGNGTQITETFEAETENPAEMQQNGWQAILNNFKKHAELNS